MVCARAPNPKVVLIAEDDKAISDIIAAIVELLPEPVAPQTRRIPSLACTNLIKAGAVSPRFNCSNVGTELLM